MFQLLGCACYSNALRMVFIEQASLKNGSKLMRCSICFRTRKSPWSAVCAEALLEPLSRSLASAQAEEDEISPRAAAALDRSRSSLARGEGISHEEIRREFGLQK